MSDSFTETTTQSWGSRMGGSFKGIIVGIILFILSFPLLWWNEGRTIERHRALEEGAGLVISVGSTEVDPANEGKLIHTSGTLSTQETLRDPEFGISAQALRLRRNVEMYQWEERKESHSEKNLGGSETTTTTYHYDKKWSDSLISSSGFRKPEGHQNPSSMPYASQTQNAANARLGAFRMSPEQVGALDNFQPINLSGQGFNQINRPHQVTGNTLYLGPDPNNPRIGDLRINFSQMPATPVSIVAQQHGGGFTAYLPKAGSDILLIEQGNQSAQAMFKAAQESNALIAWLIRVGGFLMMFFGLSAILRPLSVIGDVIPFIGSMIAFGTGTVAFLLALPLTLLTIAIAWVFYRPLLALLIGVAALASFVVPYLAKRNKVAVPPPPPPAGGAVQR